MAEGAALSGPTVPATRQVGDSLAVVDIFKRRGKTDREPVRQAGEHVLQRMRARPSHLTEQRRHRCRAPTSQNPPSLAGPNTTSCRPRRRNASAMCAGASAGISVPTSTAGPGGQAARARCIRSPDRPCLAARRETGCGHRRAARSGVDREPQPQPPSPVAAEPAQACAPASAARNATPRHRRYRAPAAACRRRAAGGRTGSDGASVHAFAEMTRHGRQTKPRGLAATGFRLDARTCRGRDASC